MPKETCRDFALNMNIMLINYFDILEGNYVETNEGREGERKEGRKVTRRLNEGTHNKTKLRH